MGRAALHSTEEAAICGAASERLFHVHPAAASPLPPLACGAPALVVFHRPRRLRTGRGHRLYRLVPDQHGRRLGEAVAAASLSPDDYVPFHVPGFGVLIALVGLTLLGFLTANIIGRTLVNFSEAMLDRTPVIRGLYKGLKQVFETVFSQSGSQFRKVALVEFPVKGSRSIVFVSSEPGPVVSRALPGDSPMISVFMPCTPNPTTGFFFYIAGRGPHRTAIFGGRGGQAGYVGRPYPAGGAGGARGDGGGSEARKAAGRAHAPPCGRSPIAGRKMGACRMPYGGGRCDHRMARCEGWRDASRRRLFLLPIALRLC